MCAKHVCEHCIYMYIIPYKEYPLTCLRCFDSCVDETLPASHGVKVELIWSETGQV